MQLETSATGQAVDNDHLDDRAFRISQIGEQDSSLIKYAEPGNSFWL
jgi:hypothetical protein